MSCDSAATFRCTQTSADDWLDTPELQAKMIIELQQHADAVARHLQTMIAQETTQSLRGFTEDNFGVSGA